MPSLGAGQSGRELPSSAEAVDQAAQLVCLIDPDSDCSQEAPTGTTEDYLRYFRCVTVWRCKGTHKCVPLRAVEQAAKSDSLGDPASGPLTGRRFLCYRGRDFVQLKCNSTALGFLAIRERNCKGDVQFYCFGFARSGGENLHRRCAILLLWIRSQWRGEITQAMCNFTALDSLAVEGRNCTGDVQFYCFGFARNGGEKLHRRCAILLLGIRSRWRGEIAQAMCIFVALDSLAMEERNCAGDAQFSRFRVPSRWGCKPHGDLCVLSFFGFIMHVGIDRKGGPYPLSATLRGLVTIRYRRPAPLPQQCSRQPRLWTPITQVLRKPEWRQEWRVSKKEIIYNSY